MNPATQNRMVTYRFLHVSLPKRMRLNWCAEEENEDESEEDNTMLLRTSTDGLAAEFDRYMEVQLQRDLMEAGN
jgi:hypothetical protein